MIAKEAVDKSSWLWTKPGNEKLPKQIKLLR